MLTWTEVLTYVEGRLALPSAFIEKSNTEMRTEIISTALRDFSDFVPDKETTVVIPTNVTYQTSKAGIYKFFDEEDLAILGLVEIYWTGGDHYIIGTPYIGPMSLDGMKEWLLQCFKANLLKPFSHFAKTYRFIPPNMVRIMPSEGIVSAFVVEYERRQPPDLGRIPAIYERTFMDLALAECQIWIGNIRIQYSELNTPFGPLPLNGERILDRGETSRTGIHDRLREETLPEIIVDRD